MGITDNLLPFTPSGYPSLPDGAKQWSVDSYGDIGNSITVLIETMRRLEAGVSPVGHTHVEADVTQLVADLAALNSGKANTVHTHVIADVTGLQAALDGKAALVHTHTISDVTGLQTALNGKETFGAYNAINTQTGTTYTLVLTDQGKLVEMNNAAAMTLTVPTNASTAFPVNSRVDLVRFGAGELSITAAGGVTIRSQGAKLRLNVQFSGATLYKRATDEWVLIGDLKT